MAKSTRSKKSPNKKKESKQKKWSGKVTATSNALDLEQGVFKGTDPKKIAQSLKRSAKQSHRRKGTPFQSAMSMLTFYINRAGDTIPAAKKKVLEDAKEELRKLFDKEKSG